MVNKKKIKIPKVLIALGHTVEVVCGELIFRFTKKDDLVLYSNVRGTALFCMKTKPRVSQRKQFLGLWESRRQIVDEAVSLYEQWHEFDPTTGSIVTAPKGYLYRIGRADSITYSSDKWTGTVQRYIHVFDYPPIMWVNSKKRPSLVSLTGGKIRVKAEGITG